MSLFTRHPGSVVRSWAMVALVSASATSLQVQALTFTSGVHEVPAGTYGEIEVSGTAVVSFGSGVEASSLGIYSDQASVHMRGGVVLSVVQNHGTLLVSGGRLWRTRRTFNCWRQAVTTMLPARCPSLGCCTCLWLD